LAAPHVLSAQTQRLTPGVANAPARTAVPTYEAVIQGMSCKQQSSGRLDCEYKVGKSLWFHISGVGQSDVVINFFRVNLEEDFVASVAPLHGCVVVRPSASPDSVASLAFVSPVDGKIYRTWNSCASKKRETDDRRDTRPRPE
jgi:hypothetical protein